MCKTATWVRPGDQRHGADGRLHQVVSKTTRPDGQVTIVYDIFRPGGGRELEIEVLAPQSETDFASPTPEPQVDEYDSA